MTSQALTNVLKPHDKARNTPPHYRISARIKRACDALVAGEARTITDAAKIANISREQLSRSFQKNHVVEYLRSKACRVLALAAGRAAAKQLELMDGAASEHVQADVSRFVLELAGIKPVKDPQVSLSITQAAGYVIMLGEPGSSHDRVVGPVIDARPGPTGDGS